MFVSLKTRASISLKFSRHFYWTMFIGLDRYYLTDKNYLIFNLVDTDFFWANKS